VETVIEVERLSKTYRKGFIPRSVSALREASFQVRKGRITGFIGANGAGKTTALRCLLRFTPSDSGSFSFFGESGFGVKARKRVGYLPEQPHFYGFLSGFEFLKFHSRLSKKKTTSAEILSLLESVQLGPAAHRLLSDYSKGMLQRVGLAQALIHCPELLILDEPMSGLDPDGRKLVKDILLKVASQGVSLFFSTHLLDDAENLCDDLVLMSKGEVRYCGELEKAFPENRRFFQLQDLSGNSDELNTLNVQSEEEFNAKLKELVLSGATIRRASPQRQSLEDLFSEINRAERGKT